MNISEVKLNNKRNKFKSSSNPFIPEAETDYDKKKAAEKKAIHEEIHRVSLVGSLV